MIVDPAQLLIFIPAALALNLTPGSDMLFCLGQGLKSGPRAGLAASAGIATGSVVHTLLAAFGLAALLAAYPLAFEIVRWAGVVYLVWLGVQSFRSRGAPLMAGPVAAGGAFHAWRDGTIVNLFNPKVAIFVLAFIPQFVDPARGAPFLRFLVYGAILNFGGTIINGLVGMFSGGIGAAFAAHPGVARLYRGLTGMVFFGLAAKLAFERR